ncbi:MAG: hypothetical protein JXN61_16710 [Sedimentisphaerales bacterium]|nr:hypothetical protein [Sedimentisphaerales bacterium]
MTEKQGKAKKEWKKPSRRAIIFATIMGWLCVLLWGAYYVYAMVHAVLSPIGQAVGAACIVLLLHTAVTAPRHMMKPPSKRRRLIVFCGAVLAMAFVVVWSYWPDSEFWRPYTFDDELDAIEAKRAVPDEDNAALLYEALFEHVAPDFNEPDILRPEDNRFIAGPWTSDEEPEVSKWLNENDVVIAGLMRACQKDFCRFPVESRIFASIEPAGESQRYKYNFCFKVLLADANRDIGEGGIDSGVEKYICALQMGEHCLQQPEILDFYRGFERKKTALGAIRRFVVENEGATKQHLDMLAKAIETENRWASDWPVVLAVEKLHAKNFCGSFYEVNEKKKVRFTRHIFTDFGRDEDQRFPQYEPNRFGQGVGAITLPLFAPWSPQTVGVVIDDMYRLFAKAAEPNFDWDTLVELDEMLCSQSRRLYGIRVFSCFVFIEASNVWRFHDAYMRDVAGCRGSRLIIGLRSYKNEHGAWPENLEAIRPLVPAEAFIDPINGGAFVYRLTEDGFVLYSKGANGLDEGGKRVYIRPKEKDRPDDMAIWPFKGCDDKDTAEKEEMVQEKTGPNDAEAKVE